MKKVHIARATKLLSAVMLGVGGLLVAGRIITLLWLGSMQEASTAEEINKLEELRNSDVITEGEFDEAKQTLLGRLKTS